MIVRRLSAVTLLVALLAAGALTSCTPPPSVLIGTHDDATYDISPTRVASIFEAEKGIGVKISRNTLRWNTVQPTSAATYDWSKVDYVVDQANQRGIQLMLVVRDAPQWANGSTDPRVVPSAQTSLNSFVTRYKTFFKAAVERYHDKVKYWEVWSEPNANYFFQPQGLDPNADRARWMDIYAQIFKATQANSQSVDTSVKISMGALSGLSLGCCITGADFLKGMIDRTVNFKYLAINPHSSRNLAPWNCPAGQQTFCDIKKIRDILVQRGKSSVQMWVTEFGWQVAGYTRSGSTTTKLRVPGNIYRLALWPNSGHVVVNGTSYTYSSINRQNAYSDINLTSPLPEVPPDGTVVESPEATQTHTNYVRAALKIFKGTYRPASGRPQQNYNFVKVAMYFLNHDRETVSFGMYGLFREPVPDQANASNWILTARPAAQVLKEEAG